jgi:hypothetical protein
VLPSRTVVSGWYRLIRDIRTIMRLASFGLWPRPRPGNVVWRFMIVCRGRPGGRPGVVAPGGDAGGAGPWPFIWSFWATA